MSLNQNYTVLKAIREVRQQGRYNFYSFSLCFFKPIRILIQLLHRFEFQITAGIVGVGVAKSVREYGQAPGHNHLHDHGCSGAWQARDHHHSVPYFG